MPIIWVTGDTHGDWIHRVNMDSFPEQREMSKDDYVIILGDFGIWRDSPQQRWYLNWLEEKHFTTLFIDGNHENYDILDSYPVEEWHGGKVHFIKPSIIHLMRGQVFEIDDLKFFTFGGASSHDISDGVLEIDDPRVKEWRDDPDKMYRINHISWWEREMPNQEEMDEGIKNLAEHNNKVDFILTHCTASSTAALLSHERLNPYLPRTAYYCGLLNATGDSLQADVETKDLYTETAEKFDIYHINVNHRGGYDQEQIKKSFLEYLDDKHFCTINKLDDITDTIVEIITSANESNNIPEVTPLVQAETDESGAIVW